MKRILFSLSLLLILAWVAFAGTQDPTETAEPTDRIPIQRPTVHPTAEQGRFNMPVRAILDLLNGEWNGTISGVTIDVSSAANLQVNGTALDVGDLTDRGGLLDGDNLGNATYSNIVDLWAACTGYLRSDGTCDTPSGGDNLGSATAANISALFSGSGTYLRSDGTKGAGDNLGTATAANVSALFTGAGDYLRSDGTKGTPATGATSLSGIADWPAGVSATEVGYLDGLTSAIQTQIGAITSTIGDYGNATAYDVGTSPGQIPVLGDDGDGGGALGIVGLDLPSGSALTVNGTRLDVSDLTDTGGLLGGSGASSLAELTDWPAGVSATEVGYLDGVTSAIQAQINAIVAGSSGFLAGAIYSDTECSPGNWGVNGTTAFFCTGTNTWATTALTSYTGNPTPDTTPNQFTFIDQTDVERNATITSAGVYVEDINTAAAISVSGGTYDINESGVFTADAGTVNNLDLVRARHTASSEYNSTVSTTVTIGGVSDTFSSTTEAEPSAPTETYALFYNADHASGTTYAYTAAGSGSLQGTAGGTQSYPAGATDPGTASSDGGNVWKAGATNARMTWPVTSGDIFSSSAGRVSLEYYAATSNGVNEVLNMPVSSDFLIVRVNANNTVQIRHRSVSGTTTCDATTSETTTDSAWNTIEARWDASIETCAVRVNGGTWATDVESGMSAFGSEPTTLMMGSNAAGVNDTPYLDGFTVWTSYAD